MPEKEAAVNRGRNDTPAKGGHDGIDALPDEVLQHVLSFLPLQEAVRTCSIARRWRHLLKSMPVLRITEDGRTVEEVKEFVNHLLLLRNRRAPVHQLEMDLGMGWSDHEPQFNLWIRHAMLCEARILIVSLGCVMGFFQLDNLPLISRHLTRLELSGVELKDHFLNFSSCPALEKLQLSVCYTEAERISSQSLKHLTVDSCSFNSYRRPRIFFPSLVTLALTECFAKTPLLESMPSLIAASVDLSDCDDLCYIKKYLGNRVLATSVKTVVLMVMAAGIMCFSRVWHRLKA